MAKNLVRLQTIDKAKSIAGKLEALCIDADIWAEANAENQIGQDFAALSTLMRTAKAQCIVIAHFLQKGMDP